MNKWLCPVLGFIVLIESTGNGLAQQSKVPQEIWHEAQQKGVVRIIVQLDVPTKETGTLKKEERLAQQKTIGNAQDKLLVELAGTQYKVRQKFKNIPGLSLEVGPDALAVLDRSVTVLNVSEVRVDKPHVQKDMPKETR